VEEGGTASLLVIALAGVVLLLGLAATFLTATAAGHRRAQAAADLAALAGATARQQGEDPCAAAARVATDNGAGLAGCRLDGADVVVSVAMDGPRHLGHGWRLRGEARAGPSEPSSAANHPDTAGAVSGAFHRPLVGP
jgi:secretion/DNA translocation related TadE-like protein